MTQPTAVPIADHLMEFVLAALVPLLNGSGVTAPHLARPTAQQAIEAYRAQSQHELLTIARIVAFALTALDNLRLSMPADLSLSMKLKLRANANGLNRAARDNTETLERTRRKTTQPDTSPVKFGAMASREQTQWQDANQPPEPADRPESQDPAGQQSPQAPAKLPQPPAGPNPSSVKPTTPSAIEPKNRLHWAGAMNTVATRLRGREAIVPPTQRQADKLWIDALTGVAGDLTQGRGPFANPAASSAGGKAHLLRTTLMNSGLGFPPHLSKF
jgi:hypothetical protein